MRKLAYVVYSFLLRASLMWGKTILVHDQGVGQK